MKLNIFKPYGATPKDILDDYKKANPEVKKMAFSCRLDPMACGKMPIFTDEDCKCAKETDGMDKRYRFTAIFGMKTSSCDLLGHIEHIGDYSALETAEIIRVMNSLMEEYIQTLPPHSSYVVRNEKGEKGPLWLWAKQGRLNEVQLPSFKREIYNYNIQSVSKMNGYAIAQTAIERISLIRPQHNFNQAEIIAEWKSLLDSKITFHTVEIVTDVSSGFYIRKLVEDLGNALNIPTTTLEIERLDYFRKK